MSGKKVFNDSIISKNILGSTCSKVDIEREKGIRSVLMHVINTQRGSRRAAETLSWIQPLKDSGFSNSAFSQMLKPS